MDATKVVQLRVEQHVRILVLAIAWVIAWVHVKVHAKVVVQTHAKEGARMDVK